MQTKPDTIPLLLEDNALHVPIRKTLKERKNNWVLGPVPQYPQAGPIIGAHRLLSRARPPKGPNLVHMEALLNPAGPSWPFLGLYGGRRPTN